MSKKRNFIYGAAAALGAAATAYVVTKYQRQKHTALGELNAGSQIIDTPLGPIEYDTVGHGSAVLMVHGGGGGYDQGLLFSYPRWGFQFIAPSRPGYLRTPIDSGPSFEEQADLFAALLDEIGIDKVCVLGMSAGGPSSIQFALRHPDRCWGLVLYAAFNAPITDLPANAEMIRNLLPYGDFPIWAIINSPFAVEAALGEPTKSQVGADPEKLAFFKAMLKTIYPMSVRSQGMFNDMMQGKDLQDMPLEEIKTPTLVMHGDSDKMVPYEQGLASAERIPNAEMVTFENGDHLAFITHLETSKPALQTFLEKHKG